MIVYFRWSGAVHYLQRINNVAVEITGSLRLMGDRITNKLSLALNASSLLKTTQRHLNILKGRSQ